MLHATGSPEAIERAAEVAGFFDTDPARFALPFPAAGISVGILLGRIQVAWEHTHASLYRDLPFDPQEDIAPLVLATMLPAYCWCSPR